MRARWRMGTLGLAGWLLIGATPRVLAAEDEAASAMQNAGGPMIVERVKSGFLVAPDFKVTTVNHTTSELAGGYAGWLTDGSLFVGGGGYWLTNRSRNRELGYGGLVVGWFAGTDRRFGFGTKALIGAGDATLGGVNVLQLRDVDVRDNLRTLVPIPAPFRVHEGFFVADPEANVSVRLTRGLRLTGSAGYRLIGGARGLNDELRGATGGLALQIGGGS